AVGHDAVDFGRMRTGSLIAGFLGPFGRKRAQSIDFGGNIEIERDTGPAQPMQTAHAVVSSRAVRPTRHLIAPRIGACAKPMFNCRPILTVQISPAIAQGIEEIALVERSPKDDVRQSQEDFGSLAWRQKRLAGRPDSESGKYLRVVGWPSRDLA